MLSNIIAVLSLSLLCGFWIVFQQWLTREDPNNPGVEGRTSCSASGGACTCGSGHSHCENEHETQSIPTKHQLHDVLKVIDN